MKQKQSENKVHIFSLLFILNDETKTARIDNMYPEVRSVIVPRTITVDTQEYIVNEISSFSLRYLERFESINFGDSSQISIIGQNAFEKTGIRSIKLPPHLTKICKYTFYDCEKLRQIEIPSDSELETIEQDAFNGSMIESLTIPASVNDLQEGCFNNLPNLKNITVSPDNQFYKTVDNFLLGKSDKKSDAFDVIIFAARNTNELTIPAGIKLISSSSFSYTLIEQIKIPSHITEICDKAFSHCKNLKKIEFEPNSQLKMIGEYAFASTAIENIVIPSSVVELKDKCFNGTSKLKTVDVDINNPNIKLFDGKFLVGKSDPKSDIFDVLHFANRDDAKEIIIPSCVRRIAPYSFSYESAQFESVTISPQVTEICERAFAYCRKLRSVIIAENSQLKIIGQCAFFNTLIESIAIPQHVERICESAFDLCKNLTSVTFCENSELSVIEREAFKSTPINRVIIPRSVSVLGIGVFESCSSLQIVEFEQGSVLDEIGERAFDASSIETMRIPKSVKKICRRAFFDCKKLKSVEFEEGSELTTVEEKAFGYSGIEQIKFPPKAISFDADAFIRCKKLNTIEVCSNDTLCALSSLQYYNDIKFIHSNYNNNNNNCNIA